MYKYVFLLFLFSSLCASTHPHYFYFYDQFESTQTDQLPIHMMFFPWDRDQEYFQNEFDFDYKPYVKMRKKNLKQLVIIWTRSKTKEFCLKYYPEVWKILEDNATRPIQYLDILRWLVVYHFGGLYWQYDSIMLKNPIDYMPSAGKQVRLFEYEKTHFYFENKGIISPYKGGWSPKLGFNLLVLQEVSPAVFSANQPKVKTVKKIVDFLLDRLQTKTVLRDADIPLITGAQALSEYNYSFGRNDPTFELSSSNETNKMFKVNAKGRWRTEKK